MEINRLELRDILANAMTECGEEPALFFQPPESVKLTYPCIIYRLRTLTSDYANDNPYRSTVSYDVTYITRSPTSKVPDKLLRLPTSAFDRYYVSDNLNHYAYTFTSTNKGGLNG